MSKIIRRLRLLKPHWQPRMKGKKGETKIPNVTEPITCSIIDIVHERGRVAPLAVCELETETTVECPKKFHLVAVEGLFVGKKIQIGNNVPVAVGNALALKNIPEGTTVSSVERVPFDGGKVAKSSGGAVIIVAHNVTNNTTVVKVGSGSKKTISSDCRGVVGIIAGGGVNEKPILKAGRAFYRAKARNIYWPRVRGVAMNPVDHPHGGGNHQHIGHPSTISKHAPPNAKVGLIAARRTGLKRGSKKVLNQ